MKKLLIAINPLIFALIVTSSFAQEFKIGVKGGINQHKIGTLYHIGTANGGGQNLTPSEDTYYQPNNTIGTQYGAFIMASFGNFYIRPEFNLNTKKSSYALALKDANWQSSSYEFPILFGINIVKPVSLYLGPTFEIINDFTLEGPESPVLYKKNQTQFTAGILVDFKWFGLDFRYQYGTEKIAKQRVDILRSEYGTNVAHLLPYTPSTFLLTAHFNIFTINPRENGKKPKASWRPNGKRCY